MDVKEIDCPDCGHKIPLDVQSLVEGRSFSCPNCPVSIGIASNSVDTLKNAMDGLSEIKKASQGAIE